jgi:hypothetical protein
MASGNGPSKTQKDRGKEQGVNLVFVIENLIVGNAVDVLLAGHVKEVMPDVMERPGEVIIW